MLKKHIVYTDFDGNERKEDFYFNLTKAEVTGLELSVSGGISKMIEKIIAEQDSKQIGDIFKDFILKSYGEKSLDGKYFVKTQALSDAFSYTEAYSSLYMELITDPKAAADFMNGIIPQIPNK